MTYMMAIENIETIRNYLDYVDEHLDNVRESWNRFKAMDQAAQTATGGADTFLVDDFLYWEIDNWVRSHDISKLSIEELVPYAEWFCGRYGVKYDMWDDGGCGYTQHEECRAAFLAAWKHHKEHNPHHWETWTQRGNTYPNEQYVHCIGMVLDWMAMGITFGDTAEEYYENNRDKIKIPKWADELCLTIFKRLRKYT